MTWEEATNLAPLGQAIWATLTGANCSSIFSLGSIRANIIFFTSSSRFGLKSVGIWLVGRRGRTGGMNMAREVCGGNSVIQQNSAKLTDLIHGSHSNLTRFSCVFAEDTNHIVWHAATLFIITFYSLGTPRKWRLDLIVSRIPHIKH